LRLLDADILSYALYDESPFHDAAWQYVKRGFAGEIELAVNPATGTRNVQCPLLARARANSNFLLARGRNRFVRALRRLRAAETFRLSNSSSIFSIAYLRILYSFL